MRARMEVVASDEAVDGCPSRDLPIGEVTRFSPELPKTMTRKLPGLLDVLNHGRDQRDLRSEGLIPALAAAETESTSSPYTSSRN